MFELPNNRGALFGLNPRKSNEISPRPFSA
jgi:hypothetical protein